MRTIQRRVILGLLLCSTTAFAGYKETAPVFINTTAGITTASGVLGSVRSSTDNVQYIGCYNYGHSLVCVAKNSAGVETACFTDNPSLITLAGTISGDSKIRFQVQNSTCVGLTVETMSSYAPKTN